MNNQNVKISFIPKEPLLRGDVIVRKRPIVGASFLIGFIIFAVALVASGGVYFYKSIRYENLIEKQEQLKVTNDQLEASDIIQSIEELRTLRDQIDHVSTILDKHIALSSLFTFLEKTTVSSISFGNFKLTPLDENQVEVIMVGQSKSYTDLAIQSNVYAAQKDFLDSYSLDGFKLTTAGTIEFVFIGVLNVEGLYYSGIIESVINSEQSLDEDFFEDSREE